MISLGGRPRGIKITHTRTKEWKDVEILAYIQNKTGEYDKNEQAVLSDPWVEGFDMRERGEPFEAIRLEVTHARASVRAERQRLRQKGWLDCDAELRSLARFAANVDV